MPLSDKQRSFLKEKGYSDKEIQALEAAKFSAPGSYGAPKQDPLQAGRRAPQTPEETAEGQASVARYGVPLAAAALTANPFITGLAMGGGEMIAQEYEESLASPEFTSWSDYLKHKGAEVLDGGTAFALGYAGQRWLAPIISRGVQRAGEFLGKNVARLAPKQLPKDVETAQRMLGEMGEANVRGPAMTAIRGAKPKPFSLTLDQLDRERQSFISWLGATSRSGLISKGMMKKYDLRNTTKLEEIVDSYISMLAKTSTPSQFGKRLQALLSGEMKLVQSTRKALYDDFRALASKQGVGVDMERFRKFIADNKNREAIQAIHRNINDLVPPLDEPWTGVNVADATEAYHRINGLAKNLQNTLQLDKRAANNVVMKNRAMFEPELKRAMDAANPEIREAFELANLYHGKVADRLENDVMRVLLKRLEKHPSGVVEAFLSPKASRQDSLSAIKTAFSEGAVPGVRRATSLSKDLYEKNVVLPLRHAVLSEAVDRETGRVTGSKLASVLDKYAPRGDTAFLKEIFGQEVDHLRNLATAMKVIEASPAGDKIFIQLIQGGSLVAAAGAAVSDQPVLERIGPAGYAIFVAPIVLAAMLGNPRTTRILTDGVKAGAKTNAFARMLTVMGTQAGIAKAKLGEMSENAIDFYSNLYEKRSPDEDEVTPPSS